MVPDGQKVRTDGQTTIKLYPSDFVEGITSVNGLNEIYAFLLNIHKLHLFCCFNFSDNQNNQF